MLSCFRQGHALSLSPGAITLALQGKVFACNHRLRKFLGLHRTSVSQRCYAPCSSPVFSEGTHGRNSATCARLLRVSLPWPLWSGDNRLPSPSRWSQGILCKAELSRRLP